MRDAGGTDGRRGRQGDGVGEGRGRPARGAEDGPPPTHHPAGPTAGGQEETKLLARTTQRPAPWPHSGATYAETGQDTL